ncbi:adhesion G-protein coupled receptor G5 [Hemicordylus capensis]|uniref:adhesion G-protein coupled receptor G5 n=1 Tax=Hemicordylus capensis TaxID=884348 RepID=UPI0023032A4B|nr:adhesion G-protein coupled receptor G5 [Hemicordylus capensis]XP_053127536.1 adhesion G-protein coupled receptor G5 [Hemicordylus capensis]XP_053127537.1 adhesion G-protein coupled receptor G5 [Hemicordylus capensis]
MSGSGFWTLLFTCVAFSKVTPGSAETTTREEAVGQSLNSVANCLKNELDEAMTAFEALLARCVSKGQQPLRRALKNVETLLEVSCPDDAPDIMMHQDICVWMSKITLQDFPGLNISNDKIMTHSCSMKPRTQHAMHFPRELVERVPNTPAKNMRLTCIYLKASCLFQDAKNSTLLNDDIIGASLGNTSVTNLSRPVEIQFWHNYTLDNTSVTCVFWVEEPDEGDIMGSWSSDGCKTRSLDGMVVCQCDHLTYFAVLLQISPGPVDKALLAPLTYLTIIGCSISASACLIIIFSYFCCRKTPHDSTTTIHMNLLGALFLLNVSFLASEPAASLGSLWWLCRITAIVLHYSLLCTLTWMAIEGFHLYLLVIRVYNSYLRHYLPKLCSLGWGLPGLAVAIIFLIKKDVYGTHTVSTSSAYRDGTMCWITPQYHIVHTLNLVYFGCIMLFNMIILYMVVQRLRQLRTKPHQQQEHFCKDTVTVLGLTCLLGTVWTLAFFSFGVFRIPQIFLFTILNSLQGFCICLWYWGLRFHSQRSISSENPPASQ